MTSSSPFPDPRRKTPKRHFGHVVMPPVEHAAGKVEEAYELPRRPLRWAGYWIILGFVVGMTSGALVVRGFNSNRGCNCASGNKGGTCGGIAHPQSIPQAPNRH